MAAERPSLRSAGCRWGFSHGQCIAVQVDYPIVAVVTIFELLHHHAAWWCNQPSQCEGKRQFSHTTITAYSSSHVANACPTSAIAGSVHYRITSKMHSMLLKAPAQRAPTIWMFLIAYPPTQRAPHRTSWSKPKTQLNPKKTTESDRRWRNCGQRY